MAVLLLVLLPPIFFTVAFVALLAVYTWRIFMGTPKRSEGSDDEPSPSSSDVDVGESLHTQNHSQMPFPQLLHMLSSPALISASCIRSLLAAYVCAWALKKAVRLII